MNRQQLARECVEIEQAGGSVREYLAIKGCISPWGTWYRLQKEELGRKDWQIRDGKGGEDMRKITLEQKKKAVEIAVAGGNPLPYLKVCGSKNPANMWYVIKQNLKEADPEKYAQIPDRISAGKKEEPADEDRRIASPDISDADHTPVMAPVPEPTVNWTVSAEDNPFVIRLEQPEDDGIEIFGLRTKIGEFQAAGGMLCFYTKEKEMVNLPVELWKQLMDTVPRVFRVMRL